MYLRDKIPLDITLLMLVPAGEDRPVIILYLPGQFFFGDSSSGADLNSLGSDLGNSAFC